MKKFLVAMLLVLSGCGYSSVDNEMTGQVKKLMKNTPLICPSYYDADISLGVMRNGVGSMSTQDVWVTIEDKESLDILQKAADTGALVKVRYNVERVVFCIDDHVVQSVSLLDK